MGIFCFSMLLFLLPLNILNLPLPLSPCSFSIEFVGHAKSGLVLLLQVKPAFSRTKLFSTSAGYVMLFSAGSSSASVGADCRAVRHVGYSAGLVRFSSASKDEADLRSRVAALATRAGA